MNELKIEGEMLAEGCQVEKLDCVEFNFKRCSGSGSGRREDGVKSEAKKEEWDSDTDTEGILIPSVVIHHQ